MRNLGITTSTCGIACDCRRARSPSASTAPTCATFEVQEFEQAVSGPGTGATGAIPRWRHFASIDGNWGAWGATLTQTFQAGLYARPIGLTCPRRVSGPGVHRPAPRGLAGGVRPAGALHRLARASRSASARATCSTVRRRLRARRRTFQIGYDASYGDPRGRVLLCLREVRVQVNRRAAVAVLCAFALRPRAAVAAKAWRVGVLEFVGTRGVRPTPGESDGGPGVMSREGISPTSPITRAWMSLRVPLLAARMVQAKPDAIVAPGTPFANRHCCARHPPSRSSPPPRTR
jgi:hypothetical protein